MFLKNVILMIFNIVFNEAFGGFKEFYDCVGHQTQGPNHTAQVFYTWATSLV